MARGFPAVLVLVLTALAVAGCASAEEPEVRRVATAFEDAAGEPAERCDLLAPATRAQVERDGPCPERIGALPLGGGEVRSVEVWGGDAQVRLTGDTVFLARTRAGWRVVAAACTPRGEELPYDCEVAGA